MHKQTDTQTSLFEINGPDFSVIKHQMHFSSSYEPRSALSHILED